MRKLVVHSNVVLHLASTEVAIAKTHRLLAPTLMRSQTLSALHEAVQRGELTDEVARRRHEVIGKLPIRLLGDAVLRRRAWQLADQLGWASTYDAEYLALTVLQADAFVTLDKALAKQAARVVTVASIDELVPKRRAKRG